MIKKNKSLLVFALKLVLFCLLVWLLAANFDWRAALGRAAFGRSDI